MSRLTGQTAVVTGAASGIGRAVAERFAAEGALVLAVDRAATVVAERPRGATEACVCDVSDPEQVAKLAALAGRVLGRWDILVNCAAVVVFGRTGETSEGDWDAVFAVNARGTWLMCRAALPAMLAAGGGAIVNVASGVGLRPLDRLAAYAASKAAVISLTRSLAVEYGRDGIRANCVCPGVVDTPMHRRTVEALAPGADAADVLAAYALKRLGTPEEIAAAVLFLASPESAFTTGATLAVDAGRTLH